MARLFLVRISTAPAAGPVRPEPCCLQALPLPLQDTIPSQTAMFGRHSPMSAHSHADSEAPSPSEDDMTVAPESYEPLDFSTCGLEVEAHHSGAHMSPHQSMHSSSSRHSGYPVDRVSGQQRVRYTAVDASTSSAGLLCRSGPWQPSRSRSTHMNAFTGVTSLPPVKQVQLSHKLRSSHVQDFSIVKEETASDGKKVFQVKWPDDRGSGSSQGGSSDTPEHLTGASQPMQPLRAHPAAIRVGARQDVFVSMLLFSSSHPCSTSCCLGAAMEVAFWRSSLTAPDGSVLCVWHPTRPI